MAKPNTTLTVAYRRVMIADWMQMHISDRRFSKKEACESMAQEAFNAYNEYIENGAFDDDSIEVCLARSDFCIKARKAALAIDKALHEGTALAYDMSAI